MKKRNRQPKDALMAKLRRLNTKLNQTARIAQVAQGAFRKYAKAGNKNLPIWVHFRDGFIEGYRAGQRRKSRRPRARRSRK